MTNFKNIYLNSILFTLAFFIIPSAFAENLQSEKEHNSLPTGSLRQTAYIKASDSAADDYFGRSVAIEGDTMVVGASGNDAVYIFKKESGTWHEHSIIKGSNTTDDDSFGSSVAISGDTIVVGATREQSNATGINGDENNNSLNYAGAVYVFVNIDNKWTQQAYIKASNTKEYNIFGSNVSISGDTIIVGADWESSDARGVNGDQNNTLSADSGAVYVYHRENKTWSQQAYIKSPLNRRCASFGSSLDVSNNTIIIGEYNICGSTPENPPPEVFGNVFIFTRDTGAWSYKMNLQPLNAEKGDNFGSSVSISNNSIVVGASFEDSDATGINGDGQNNDLEYSGAAYVFTLVNNTWEQQAYIKATNSEISDGFGGHVFIDNDSLLIGSPNERSEGAGINPVDGNSELYLSGAAYVFHRNDNEWNQIYFIKASNPDEYDEFGGRLAISGNSIIAGVSSEDSNAVGVDGDQQNNDNRSSGAVYMFEYNTNNIQPAHTALWYDQDQNGHGINVYMLPNNRIVAFWYVYDDQGNQVWLLGVGNHDGIKASLDVTIYDGPMFPHEFDTNDLNSVTWGKFEIDFYTCDTGLFRWFPVDSIGFTAGQMNLTRVTKTLGLECVENETLINSNAKTETKNSPVQTDSLDSGYSALWYNPNQIGHGINVYMLSDNHILAIWYVYDTQGNQVWLLGQGEFDGTSALLNVTIHNGAMFPPNYDEEDLVSTDWGTFELNFSGCKAGTFNWQPIEGNGYTAGGMDIVRLNTTLGLTCTDP